MHHFLLLTIIYVIALYVIALFFIDNDKSTMFVQWADENH